MKAITIPGLRQLEVVDLPKPEAKAGEVLLRLEYVGFCGSDLNTFLGRNTMAKANVIPGHEIGAVIEAVEKVHRSVKIKRQLCGLPVRVGHLPEDGRLIPQWCRRWFPWIHGKDA